MSIKGTERHYGVHNVSQQSLEVEKAIQTTEAFINTDGLLSRSWSETDKILLHIHTS